MYVFFACVIIVSLNTCSPQHIFVGVVGHSYVVLIVLCSGVSILNLTQNLMIKVSGPGLTECFTGCTTAVTVTVQSEKGEVIEAFPTETIFGLIDKKPKSGSCQVSVTRNPKEFLVTYLGQTPGVHALELSVLGVPVPGSPFTVMAEQVHCRHSRC
jgi:hypothetical protein